MEHIVLVQIRRLTSSWIQALYPGGLMAISTTVAVMRMMRNSGETYFHR